LIILRFHLFGYFLGFGAWDLGFPESSGADSKHGGAAFRLAVPLRAREASGLENRNPI
jgi:hypothetical protein